MGDPRAILIAGPTGSGKSALALRLAERLGGIVLNADSMQVYRDLAIITARPVEADVNRAPHALYGTVDGAASHSVTRWLADLASELTAADARVPIIVGGTGLYLKALTQGLSAIPDVPATVRAEVRAWAAGRPAGELHAELAARDPLAAARLRPSDPQRILRALEVHRATGKSLAAFQERREPPLLDAAHCRAVRLVPDRDEQRARLDRRFDAMMDAGALTEVRRLAARTLDIALPVMRALGVPPLLDHLGGRATLAEAVARAKADTRRYVRRQDTFARHQLQAFRPVPPEHAEAMLLDR